MRKFSFSILLLTLLMALTTLNLSAQRGERDDDDNWGGDRFRSRQEERDASDLREGKHQDRSRNSSGELNPFFARPGFAATTGGTTAVSSIIDHGGPVMNQPVIYVIFYGNWNQTNGSDTAAGKQIVLDWAAGIGSTAHYSLNASYAKAGYPTNGTAVFGGSTTLTGSYSTRLTDAQILSTIVSTINAGQIRRTPTSPNFDPNGVYFLVTSSDVTARSGFCTQYCGWHSASTQTFGRLRYSFVGNAKRCVTSCAAQSTVSPNGNPGIDGTVSVLTHELEETHSDPDLNAWYDSSGAENADKCAWTFGHFQFQTANGSWANISFGGRNWLIQRNLLNGASDFCMVDATHN
ncbi:MAG: EXORDIUM family protein [Pyrinomonadaceae bacterium]|nr:EXORDIUM family protein [Pyrinomonadaceae bacterium]